MCIRDRVSTTAGKVKNAFAPVTAAIGGVAAAAVATVPATEEFRADLSLLDNNARQAGVGIDAVRKAFMDFNTISGETDSSIEAVSNLLQACLLYTSDCRRRRPGGAHLR